MADESAGQKTLNLTGSIIAFGIVSLLAFITWAVVFHEIPDKNTGSFSTVLGIVSMAVGAVIGFFFGNTVGSKKQSETNSSLASAVNTALNTPVAPKDETK